MYYNFALFYTKDFYLVKKKTYLYDTSTRTKGYGDNSLKCIIIRYQFGL